MLNQKTKNDYTILDCDRGSSYSSLHTNNDEEMSARTIHYCDLCREELPVPFNSFGITISNQYRGEYEFKIINNKLELCDECHNIFIKLHQRTWKSLKKINPKEWGNSFSSKSFKLHKK